MDDHRLEYSLFCFVAAIVHTTNCVRRWPMWKTPFWKLVPCSRMGLEFPRQSHEVYNAIQMNVLF